MSSHFGQTRLRARSTRSCGSRSMLTSHSPADSCGSSTCCSSKASNQMPPQPARQTSTVSLPMVTELSGLKQAGHFIASGGAEDYFRRRRWSGLKPAFRSAAFMPLRRRSRRLRRTRTDYSRKLVSAIGLIEIVGRTAPRGPRRRELFQLNRRRDLFRHGVRFIGENDLDGVEAVGAPVVFLEQPGPDKLGYGLAALFAHQREVSSVIGILRECRGDVLLQFRLLFAGIEAAPARLRLFFHFVGVDRRRQAGPDQRGDNNAGLAGNIQSPRLRQPQVVTVCHRHADFGHGFAEIKFVPEYAFFILGPE